jgi:uncharacterized protein (UPF0212 family)
MVAAEIAANSRRLVRQAGDQVDIDVGNSCGPEVGNVVEHRGALVQASDRGGLLIDEGLNAKADAIHAATQEGLEELAKRAFRERTRP